MRTIVVVVVQVVLAVLITASVLPFVLVSTPAAQESAPIGIGLAVAIVIVAFTLIALVWPKRLR